MALAHFGHLLEVGYNQLYFLIVIMEFYAAVPAGPGLLRRTKGHHGLVLAAAVAAQFAMSIGMHWKLLPDVVVAYGQENAACYVLYLLGGAIVAFHLSDVHDWVVRNAPLVVFLTVASAVFAEAVYFLSRKGFTHILGYGSDPFQPSVIPFNVCVIALGYLAGMYLVRPWRSRRTKAAVRIGSDNAYGIYLAQMIFITSLGALGWKTFVGRAPFWVWVPLTVATAYFGGILLTALLARTPLAVPLTGRKQEPWRTLLPRRVPAPTAARTRTQTRRLPSRWPPPGPLVPYSSGACRAGGHHDRSERNLTVLTEQIDEAAASRGDAPYLEDAAGDRDADLRRAAALGAGLGPAPGRGRDTSRRPGGGPAAGCVRLRRGAGRHPRGGPGGGAARPGRPGRVMWRGC